MVDCALEAYKTSNRKTLQKALRALLSASTAFKAFRDLWELQPSEDEEALLQEVLAILEETDDALDNRSPSEIEKSGDAPKKRTAKVGAVKSM